MTHSPTEPVALQPRHRAHSRRPLVLGAISLSLGLVVAGIMLGFLAWRAHQLTVSGPGPGSADLPVGYSRLPDFELTERSGRTVRRADLEGQVWVASFIFTRCHETCPMVTGVMARLRAELPKEVRLVSISVDPRHDRPEVLQEYAKNQGADSESWWFLTGPREEVYRLVRDGFKLSVAENPDPEKLPGERVSHSTRLAVVDREGNVRGLYDSSDPSLVSGLARKVRSLVAENP